MDNILDDENLIELKIPDVAYKILNLHLNTISDLKSVEHYEHLSWYKILKHYYKINYGDSLKLQKDDIKPLTDLYSKINSGNPSDYSSYDILEYIYIINNLINRLSSDKSLGHKFAYDNLSLNMELLYWIFGMFKHVYNNLLVDSCDDKLKYSFLKESNSILSYLIDNYNVLFSTKLHHLPKLYHIVTLKYLKQLVNSMQQEIFIKITINNSKSKTLNYSLLSKMAYQVYLYYNDENTVKFFLQNRYNNYYASASDEKDKNSKDYVDFFLELSNTIAIKKSFWLIIAVYYHCLNLYSKNGKHGEPISILKVFLNNYSFNEHHEEVVKLKKQLINLLNVITKDNDFIYHEEVDTSTEDYQQVIESKITPLNSNKFIKLEENLRQFSEDPDLNSKIDKMFHHILNLKTLELESIFTAEKEDFLKVQTENILTENMELVTLIDYNQLELLCSENNTIAEDGDLDLASMHKAIETSKYKDIPVIRKQVDYLRQKAVEMTSKATTDNQVALQNSLKNAIENDNKLFENVKLHKNEIDLLRNYDNLVKVYETLKQKTGNQEINLIDYEDPTKDIISQLKEKLEILKEIQYQRNLLLKKFKPNSATQEEELKEHNDVVKIILEIKDTELLKQKFNEYISEKYSFETSTLTALSKQQKQVSNDIESLVYQLQSAKTKSTNSGNSSDREFTDFKQKLSDALDSFQTFEQNCKECISYYNSLFDLIPKHF